MKNIIKYLKNVLIKKKWRISKCGKSINIGFRTRFYGAKQMCFGDNVSIYSDSFIMCFNSNSSLIVGRNVSLGQFNRIGCYGNVIIEDYVLTAPNVFIADHNHNYEDITLPICLQGLRVIKTDEFPIGGVRIGEGSWLGKNVVVAGSLTIGKHCVIGANSVVTSSIPDYSVAVGSPAKVVKYFDFDKDKWITITKKDVEK